MAFLVHLETLSADMAVIRKACETGIQRKEKYAKWLSRILERCQEIDDLFAIVSTIYAGDAPENILKIVARLFALTRGWKQWAGDYCHAADKDGDVPDVPGEGSGTTRPLATASIKPPGKSLQKAIEELWWCNREAELHLITDCARQVSSVMVFLKRPGQVWFAGRHFIAYGLMDKLVGTHRIRLFDRATLEPLQVSVSLDLDVWSLAEYRGRSLVAGLGNGAIHVYDTDGSADASPGATLKGHEGPVSALCVYDRVLYSGAADKTIKVWNMQTMSCDETLPASHWVSAISYEPGSRFLYCGTTAGFVHVFDMHTSTPVQVCAIHEGAVQCMDMYEAAAGGLVVCTGGDDSKVKLWPMEEGLFPDPAAAAVFSGHKAAVVSVAVQGTRDSRVIVSTDTGGVMVAWNAATLSTLIEKGDLVQHLLKLFQST